MKDVLLGVSCIRKLTDYSGEALAMRFGFEAHLFI